MRLATVRTPDGATMAAVADGDDWRALPASDLSALLVERDLAHLPRLAGDPVPDATPVLPLPRPAKVLCCGLNYADHIRETGRDVPTHPTVFAKYADTLTGPEDDVVLPEELEVDWEAELAVVVGRPLRGATREEAADGIAGYTVANDISVRNWQRRTSQWLQGKCWDRSTPVGPVLVTADELDPSTGLDVVCRVNGTERQRGSTATLVFDCPTLLAYVSTFTALRPGDLVLTGTPGGVGMSMDPPTYLASGDLLETEITDIGTVRNRVQFTDRSTRWNPT